MRAKVVADIAELREERIAGSIEYRTFREDGPVVGIAFVCPCGCARESFLPMRGRGHPHEWDWDGNREAPTLTPSIQQVGGCGWHGWLRAGEWVPC